MRRQSLFFLCAYIILTLYIYGLSFLGLPHQVWTFFTLPLLAIAFVLSHSDFTHRGKISEISAPKY